MIRGNYLSVSKIMTFNFLIITNKINRIIINGVIHLHLRLLICQFVESCELFVVGNNSDDGGGGRGKARQHHQFYCFNKTEGSNGSVGSIGSSVSSPLGLL